MELFGRFRDSRRVAIMVTGRRWQPAVADPNQAEPTVHSNELFLCLVRENENVLLRVALRLCNRNRDQAEEFVQEAIVSAYKVYISDRFSDVANFRPWILRILTNAYLKECRRNRHFVSVPNFEDLSESFSSPNSDFYGESLSPGIEEAMTALSQDQRLCITLIDINELEYSETAKILGVPIGTVRSRIARARLKMAGILATQELEELRNV